MLDVLPNLNVGTEARVKHGSLLVEVPDIFCVSVEDT